MEKNISIIDKKYHIHLWINILVAGTFFIPLALLAYYDLWENKNISMLSFMNEGKKLMSFSIACELLSIASFLFCIHNYINFIQFKATKHAFSALSLFFVTCIICSASIFSKITL